MRITKIFRIVFISLIILILLTSGLGFVYAATVSDLQDINKKIQDTNNEIKEVKKEMSSTLTQISKLNSEISTYEDEIDELGTQIDGLSSQISLKEQEILEQEEKFKTQCELFEKRVIALYEMGDMGYLEILLSSGNLYELVSKYYLITEIAENDNDLLNKITATKNSIMDQKEYIQSAKSELETSQKSMESKKISLAASRNTKQTLVSNLTEEEAALEAELEEYEKDKRRIQQELAAIAKNSTITVSPGGYISPLAGKSKANITTGYGRYSWGGNHTGVDFACAGGTPIYAVKDGTVVISTALKRENGSYKSYGEYIVIDHHDGTMTLYAHMSPGTRLVGVNSTVYQGQQIGSVGATGNATGNHLHFEVRINGKPVNPTSYLP